MNLGSKLQECGPPTGEVRGKGGGGWQKELTYVRSLNFITRNFAYAGEAVSLLHSLPREERCVTTLKTAV